MFNSLQLGWFEAIVFYNFEAWFIVLPHLFIYSLHIHSSFILHSYFIKLPCIPMNDNIYTGHLLDIYQNTLNFKRQVTLTGSVITLSISPHGLFSYTLLEHVWVLNKKHIYYIKLDQTHNTLHTLNSNSHSLYH